MATTTLQAWAGARRDPSIPHSFVCGDRTLTWQASWYNEPFYTASASFYDARALWGPINPPWDIWSSISACRPPPTATYFPSIQTDPVPETISSGSSASPLESAASPSAAALASNSGPLATATLSSSLRSSIQTSIARDSSTSSATSLLSSAFSTRSSSLFGASTTMASISGSALVGPPWSTTSSNTTLVHANNFHAGTWDSQAQGVAFAAALALTLGALVWGTWMLLRGRFSDLFAPRSWFLPTAKNSSSPGLAAFLTPFRHLPALATPTGEAMVATHVQAAVLGIAGIGAFLSLAVFLPLMVAGVPHLSETAPPNTLGGRLGTLTDLSILRLLDALDPSSQAATTQLRRDGMMRRALSTTVTPALGSARGRLIAIVVLSGTLWVGGSLFIISRAYSKLVKYAQEFEDACAGQELVFLPNQEGWAGKSEAEIKRSLAELCKTEGDCIAGVFSVGHLLTIRALIHERTHVHGVLESVEAKYINSLVPVPKSHLLSTDFSPGIPQGSAFLEVQQRSSVIRNKGKLMIGQRVIQDDDGTFLPAPDAEPSGSESKHISVGATDSYYVPLASSVDHNPLNEKDRPISQDSAYTNVAQVNYRNSSRPVSQLVGGDLVTIRADITWSRARLTKLNAQVDRAQSLALTSLTSGSGETIRVGCIIVGRGVKSLPNAIDIEGRSKEDILWDNLGEPNGVRFFWAKVAGLMLLAAAICLPFLGLAVASAPGISDQLTFLGPLSKSNGLGSGIASGLTAAVAISLALAGGIVLIHRFARESRPVSFMALQALAVKATFYFLFAVGTLCFILIGAVVFAVPWFKSGFQKSRGVGDGTVFITFLSLVLIINICILIPGLLILQPIRLFRWYEATRKADTPRKRFQASRPPTFNPTIALAPLLAGFFYLSALAGLAPLLVIPVLILAYLTLVSATWLASQVFCISRGGPSNGKLAIWVVRRLGWAVCLQPFVLGLVLLTRREWVAGGIGLGLAAIGVIISEVVAFGWHRKRPDDKFLGRIDFLENDNYPNRAASDHSLLVTLYTLLPGLSRLPDGNPLPLATDAIDDMRSTEQAAYATPNVAVDAFQTGSNVPVVVMGPTDETRGLIYPPELIAPAPTIWLPRDLYGYAQREADALSGEGLEAFIDPRRIVKDNGAAAGQ